MGRRKMARYFFDCRDGDRLISDPEGMELSGIKAARDEATRVLAELARDIHPSATHRALTIEVRDEMSYVLIRASIIFEVKGDKGRA
jgi:hypothetical protein